MSTKMGSPWAYDPSAPAAIIFTIIFGVSVICHIYQLTRTRTWFIIPFIIGGVFELVGYVARAIAAEQTTEERSSSTYITQTLLLIVAPTLFAASIYMELSRISIMAYAPSSHLLISRRWLTRLFVLGDVISFALQALGGGLLSSDTESQKNLGSTIVVIGLFVQIVFFGGFITVAVIFHLRMVRSPPREFLEQRPPYKKHLIALYIMSALIFVRSIVRVVEFIQGFGGYIASHEVFLYVFDAAPMAIVTLVLNWVHPSEVKSWTQQGGQMLRGFSLETFQATPSKSVGLAERNTSETQV